ncbi:RHS repeat-associated core domain-containing protein [Pseudomonas sp. NFX98]|uniref:RHS repeat-associated core domain-containing protein n=1 Tax=Pseudomonas sp. NFX98 TaxID=3399122 RepID=UPI0039FBC701
MNDSKRNILTYYAYDALDRLTRCAPARQFQQDRFYQSKKLTTEIQGVVTHQILQHSGILLAETHSGPTDHMCLLAVDNQRSVLMSDATNIAYTPYGHRNEAKDVFGRLGFNGERRETITGYYLLGNGHRAFNPVLMRFNSPDSLSPFGEGGLNCYAYCEGDPINYRDPTGKWNVHGWFANALLEVVGDYVVPYIPKRAVAWIPGVGNRTFGRVAKRASKIGGVLAGGYYLSLNRYDAYLYEEELYNKLFAGYLAVSTFSTISAAASTLHKIARKGAETGAPLLARYRTRRLSTISEAVESPVPFGNSNTPDLSQTSFNAARESEAVTTATDIRNGRRANAP